MQFFALWCVGLLITLIYLVPVCWSLWNYVNLSIDFGPDAASILYEETQILALYAWMYVWSIAALAHFIMSVMTTSRRLAHIGISRWWILLGAVPVVNIIFLLFLFLMPGKKVDVKASEL